MSQLWSLNFIKQKAKENYAKNSAAVRFQNLIWYRSIEQCALGQMMEYSYLVLHRFIFPQIIRHHYSNLFDVPFGAGLFNSAQMLVTGGKSRPILSSLVSLSVFSGNKYLDSRLRRGGFDWKDEGCFLIGTAAYLTINLVAQRRYMKSQLKNQSLG